MKSKILILGYFGYETNQLDGQTIKTRNVFDLIKSKESEFGEVTFFDTELFQSSKLNLFLMFREVVKCKKLIYLPAQNNFKYLFPLIFLICQLRKVEIIYIVIGGWLADYIYNKKIHIHLLSKIKCILVESQQLRDKLISQYHYNNVIVFPNFRIHNFIPSFKNNSDQFKIVFMARINRLKGIDLIFRLIEYFDKCKYQIKPITIDFYGPIDSNDEEYFKREVLNHSLTSYKGIAQPNQVYDILSQYDLVVLPTKYPGEGFPGTILDAYISGLPVIVSNWKYLPEFIINGKTGYVFNLDNESEFFSCVEKLYLNTELLQKMKFNAYEKSKEYSADKAWKILKTYLLK